jgi:uncharacterized membrane protein
MKIKVLVGALVFLMLVNLAAIGAILFVHLRHARSFPGVRDLARGRPLATLDREERRALFRAMREHHEQSRDLIEATHVLEDEAIAAMGENPVPRARIDSLLERISENRLEIARRATGHLIEMGESLGPEEREHMMEVLMHVREPSAAGPRHLPPDFEEQRREK